MGRGRLVAEETDQFPSGHDDASITPGATGAAADQVRKDVPAPPGSPAWQIEREREWRCNRVKRREERRDDGKGSARTSPLTAKGMAAVGAGEGRGDVVVVGGRFGRKYGYVTTP